jgi:hypothetical protein
LAAFLAAGLAGLATAESLLDFKLSCGFFLELSGNGLRLSF